MKHKHLTLVLSVLMSMTASVALSGNFARDGIWYNITSSSEPLTVEVTYQGDYPQLYNEYIGSVTIPESVISNGKTYSVTSIGKTAFYKCSGLISITIPNSVTSIGNEAFSDCSGLTSINIPNSVTSIGNGAFSGCSGLTSVSIGNSVTSIGNSAFSGCSGLTGGLTIPNSVTSIGDGAFYCTFLKTVTIGSSVLSIGSNVFGYGHPSTGSSPVKVIWLTNTPPSGYKENSGKVNYVPNDQYTKLSNKIVYPYLSSLFEVSGVKYVPVSPSERTCDAIDCLYDSTAENINIGKTISYHGIDMTVKTIRDYVCIENPYIKTVLFNHDCTIPYEAFYGCTALETVTINNQGDVGESAFANSKINGTLTVSNVGDIQTSAFSDIIGSFTANINNTGGIAPSAFKGCAGLTTVTMQNNGVVPNNCFQGCTMLQVAIIGNGITRIGQNAFDGCTSLQSIDLLDNVSSIGQYAFQNCSALHSARVGTGITKIPSYAFSGCSTLTNMQIGENVQTIDKYAFNGCAALSAINIPKAVNIIGDYTFKGCLALKQVIMEDKASELTLGSNGSSPLFADCPLDSVYVGRNISYSATSNKGYSPFYRNTKLKSIHFAGEETEISTNEFYGCTNLKNVRLGNGLTTIGDWAFSGCSSIEYFSFGACMKNIGKEAFSDCTAMTRLYGMAPIPPTCGDQALDDINKWNCTLIVPEGYISAYQAAPQWKEFFFINEIPVDKYTITYMVDGEVYKTIESMAGLTLIAEDMPTKEGYSFSGWNGLPDIMPAHDVIVSGTFTINSYWVTYKSGNNVLSKVEVEYGSEIPLPPEIPTNEGYTFSGWEGLPETMPAHDVTVTALFSVNSYTVTFMHGDEVLSTATVEYGAEVALPETPEKEGYSFTGWDGLPETMPAHDVTVTAQFTVNSYTVTFMRGDEVLSTVTVEYGAEIPLPETLDSDRYTLVEWKDVPETMPAHDITIYADYTDGIESIENETMRNGENEKGIYDLSGRKVSNNGQLTMDNGKLRKGIYIVNGKKTIVK